MRSFDIPGKLVVAANQKTKEKEYWLNKLSGELFKSIFPYDSEEDNKTERTGKRELDTFTCTLDNNLYPGLIKLSTGADVKLHIILAAALTALLEKYTPNNHSDIIIGTPIYKQRQEGEYINTVLPIRNPVKPDMTFKELLLQTRETVVEASRHQSYPLEVLLNELDMNPYTTDFPLFDVGILLENIQDKKDINHIPVNLLFSFSRNETTESITMRLEYNSSLYKKATTARIVNHFNRLLDRILVNVDIPISGIDILSAEDKKQLLIDFNDTDALYPKDKTVHELFEKQVEKTPDYIAVTGLSKTKYRTYKTYMTYLTYKELNERANQLACELRLKGVGPNTIAAIILEPCIELVIGILAILKAGGAYLPIDSQYPEERTVSILNESGASLLLTRSGILKKYAYTALQGLKYTRMKPYMTGLRPQSDFECIPHPDRSLIDFKKYSHYIGHAMVRHAVSIQGTRGCPYLCAYCHRTMEKKNAARSAENIFEEVKYYYQRGVRRFAFVDEIFNLDAENSMRFYRLILKNKMNVQLFFPNGMRADRLTKDYIDLMVEAGTVNVGLALETASPRLQKLIKKNLNIDKLRENAEYFCSQYPQVIVELFTMHGFPTETEEEAMSTLNLIKSLKWIHFPYVFLLKIHPSTDMMQLALDSGISPEAIERSMTSAFHEIPETLPYPKSFTRQYVAQFMNEYFLSKERLVQVLPYQAKIAAEKELVGKYDSYLPTEIKTFDDILAHAGIKPEELKGFRLNRDDSPFIPDYQALRKSRYTIPQPRQDALRILLLDLSVLFTSEKKEILHGEITEPLGLMYLLTYLRQTFKERINGKMYKAKIDFDNYEELKTLVCDFHPHLIGIRTLSYFKDFFHETVSLIKEWGIDAAIIAGGPYGTSDYRLVLQDPNVDLTVLKEGEITLAQLVEEMLTNGNKLPPEEVLETIPGIAFIKEKDRKILRKTNRELVCLDKISTTIKNRPVRNLPGTAKPGDLLYLISTSGSTGKPKSVMLEHRNLVNLLHFQFTNTGIDFNKVLQFASIGFDVSAQEICSTLLAGGELYLITNEMKSDLLQLFDYIRRNNIEILFLPPAFLRFVFSDPRYFAEFPGSVKHIITAGEQLIIGEAFRNYIQENKVVLHNHYGPSETHVVTTLTLKPGDKILHRPPIGRPTTNTRIYILDEAQNPKPLGAVGELYIAGANVGRGYLNNPELTAERFRSDFYRSYKSYRTNISKRFYKTGDLARWLYNGSLEFIGRVDYQIKIRGFRIEPGEVERALLEITAVKEAVVIDGSDDKGDKYLCAYLVSPEELNTSDLKDALSLSLPDYMIPAYFVQVPRIPLTPNGKINGKALPGPDIKTADNSTYIAPENEIERKLAEIWSEVLDLDRDTQTAISTDADFFELGGHSLKATILISRIHKEMDVKVTLAEIFEAPTIRGLAQYIKSTAKDTYESIKVIESREYYDVTHSQKRLWVLSHVKKASLTFNMTAAYFLKGKLNKDAFNHVFETLVERHESLRTVFITVEKEPKQKVLAAKETGFALEHIDLRKIENKRLKAREWVEDEANTCFDLVNGPLLRGKLIRLEEEEYLFLFNMHHIISDGASTEVLINEVLSLYEGYQERRENPLIPLRIQYKDYAAWQNERLSGKKMKMLKQYWLNQLQGKLPILSLPTDKPRPGIKGHDGDVVSFYLDEELTGQLRALTGHNNVTLFMTLLAALKVLFYRYTGQTDIIVGTPAAAREHADLEGQIGFYINTLALRTRFNPGETFETLLKRVKEVSLAAYENQEYPFDELVDNLGITRDLSRHPIFDVVVDMINVDSFQKGMASPTSLQIGLFDSKYTKSKFDLTFYIYEEKKSIKINVEYSVDLFERETISRMCERFQILAAHIVKNPLGNISQFPIEKELKLSTISPITRISRPL